MIIKERGRGKGRRNGTVRLTTNWVNNRKGLKEKDSGLSLVRTPLEKLRKWECKLRICVQTYI